MTEQYFQNDVQGMSDSELSEVINLFSKEIYGDNIYLHQDPVDNMWIIFDPRVKKTLIVAPTLQGMYELICDEYTGYVELGYGNVPVAQFDTVELN